MSYKILDERDIDLKYSSNSKNAQSGKAVAEAIKEVDKVYVGTGEMPEGHNIQINPEGSAYELPVTDQNYNPESENAQSGIAVAEALLGVGGGLKDFELLCDTTITEDVAEIKWTNTDSGEPISNYKDFFIYFLGSFTATENGGTLYSRSNGGSNYHMWNYYVSKTTNTRGFWILIESLFKIDEIDSDVGSPSYEGTQLYKSTYPLNLLGNVNEGKLATQGLSENNRTVYSDVCISDSNNYIYELYIGQPSSGTAIFAAGSRFLLLGRKA